MKRAIWVLTAICVGCGAFEPSRGAEERATAAVETSTNVAPTPNPGDDWVLRSQRDGVDDAAAKEGKTETRAIWADVAAVGKIVAIDAAGIATEDRRSGRRERTPKRPGDAILFLPPVDPSAAEAFCVKIRKAPGDRNRDRFWLRNGDEFDGELLRVDRRRVWVRAFDVEFAVPRGRVRAVRFAEIGEDGEKGGKAAVAEDK